MKRGKNTLAYLLAAGVPGSLLLTVGCSSDSFCQVCSTASPQSTPMAPEAQYVNAATTVGTLLSVVPSHPGTPINQATCVQGNLPPGMSLNPDGSITGTPTQAGVYALQIQLVSNQQPLVRPVVITVNEASSDPIDAAYANATTTVGTPLSVPPVVATGGPIASTKLLQGSIPPGMTLEPQTGNITGTPTQKGVYPATLDLMNSAQAHVAAAVVITVNDANTTPITANYTDGTTSVGETLRVVPTVTSGGPVTSATLNVGAIPPGMLLNADGSVAGSPTQPGTFVAQVILKNADGSVTPQTLTLTVNPLGTTALTGSYNDLTATLGSPLTDGPSLAMGGPCTGAKLSSGSLPPGCTLASDGTITGTPTSTGLFTAILQLTNGSGASVLVPVHITVVQPTLGLGYGDQTFPQGGAIAAQAPALSQASNLPTSYSLTAGQLPAGLVLDGTTGLITGTPTTPGISTFTITAVNGIRSASAQVTYTITNSAALGLSYASQTFSTGGSISPQLPTPLNETSGISSTYAVQSGALPDGLTLNPNTGAITGTPTTPGVFQVQIRITNGTRTATAPITYVVEAASALGLSYTNQTYTQGTGITPLSPALTNATPGISTTYALTGGSLPSGLSLDATSGQISGTPLMPGVFTPTITATNGSRNAQSSPVLTVLSASIFAVDYSGQTFAVGSPISAQSPVIANATPGIATTYALTSGALPAGLSLNATTGAITGSPTTPGVSTFTVTATNGTRTATSTVTYTVTPSAALAFSLTNQVFAQNSAVSVAAPTVSNATPGVSTTFALTSGSLPAGLSLNASTGVITGSPTTPGVSSFTVTATNGTRTATSTATYTVTPAATLSFSLTSQVFAQNSAVSVAAPTVSNATPGVSTTFALTSGSLPAGLSLNASTGAITGSPTTPGVSSFTITATNGTRTATSTVTYTVTPAAALAFTLTDQLFTQNSAVSVAAPTVSNATPGVSTTFALTSGSLPPGLSLNAATGAITGSPTAPGVSSFTVTATNGTRTATSTVTYTVTPAAALAFTLTDQLFTQNSAVSVAAPTVSNATPGVSTTFALTSGSLPAGLSLNAATGAITGSPTTPGVSSFTVTATNGTRTATSTVTYTVTPAAALAFTLTDQVFTQNSAVSVAGPTVSNPTPGVSTTFAVTSGSLPAGLSLNASTGAITGSPTTPGVSSFTVTATNGTRTATSTPTYTITPAAALTVSYANATFTDGTPISSQNPSLTNATPGVSTTYAVTTGTLPTGLTLNASNGVISGTPHASGTFNGFIITATNGTRTATSAPTYTINPAAPITLGYTTPVTYTAGYAISDDVPNPTGGTPTSYSLTAGTLPTGLHLDGTTGHIYGTPTVSGGPTSITIQGSNAAPGSASQTLSITVSAAPTASLASNPATVPVGQSSSLTVLFTGSASGSATLSGDGLATTTVTSGSSFPTGVVNTPNTTRNYLLQVTDAQGHTVSSNASVQWIPVPADTWTQSIPTGGGTFTPGSGNLLNGQITITVPDQGQSTCGDVILTVNKEATLPGALTGGASNYSTTFNIASNQGYPFRIPITVTLTYDPTQSSPNLDANDLPMAFYWDPSYSQWVSTGLKKVDTTAHTVTFTTLQPGRYVVLGIHGLTPATQTLSPTFASGTDDWQQYNPSIYDLPGGASLGMGSFEAWFAPFRKATYGTGLYNAFPSPTDAKAEALLSRLANGTMDSWAQLWEQKNYLLTNKQTGQALLTGLKVTGQPQVFLMGDARPAVNTALATAVYGYDNSLGKFQVADPNYPGNALTITWNASTGAFSSYDRAAGYSPALAAFAFEGQTSIHRLADYDRVLNGAQTSFPASTFATVSVDHIAGNAVGDITQTTLVNSANNVVIHGSVTNGDETATHIFWSQNGESPRTPVPLNLDGTFTFTIPALADPYGTTIALETSANPCDPTFSHSGFLKFVVKEAGLSPWFLNSCFEDGLKPSTSTPLGDAITPVGWVLEQGSNSGFNYPASPTWDSGTGVMSGYAVAWTVKPVDSALVSVGNDPYISTLPMVLDGLHSFRVNDISKGAHISRLSQVVVVPSTVARPKLTFYWAAAMEDPGHTAAQQPYVDILVQDASNGYETLYYKHFYAGDPTYPGWVTGGTIPGGSPVKGILWQKVSLNLGSGRPGHNVKVTITASDCSLGGHGGVAYLDSIGCQ